jgi:hypothetical protein
VKNDEKEINIMNRKSIYSKFAIALICTTFLYGCSNLILIFAEIKIRKMQKTNKLN